ncbi:MAG: hypothetical protein LH472_07640 [Pyrinomonadaceae bacterium]|nr:hypothetical protein [Pyrinomonadaceae bacterium]
MSQNFQAGDFLIFQIESGYGLLRLLGIDETADATIWHLKAYNEMFLDIETADAALESHQNLTVSIPHVALTNRAFESTQVAIMQNQPLNADDLQSFENWKSKDEREIYDRSIRLMLGLR